MRQKISMFFLISKLVFLPACVKQTLSTRSDSGSAPAFNSVGNTPQPTATPTTSTVDASSPIETQLSLTTKYPVILHHGFLGSEKVLSFTGLHEHLTQAGVKVHKAEVSAVNSVSYRSRQLAAQIDEVMNETQSLKVNIIAHSMGGLDARYLISTLGYGDRVATLTTLGTPHWGTPLADAFELLSDDYKDSASIILNFLGATYNKASDMEDAQANEAIDNLTTTYMTEVFNVEQLDDDRVLYQSYAGISGIGSQDKMKSVLIPLWTYLRATEGQNDGIVPVESAKWGEYKGSQTADHLDLVNVSMGDESPRPFEFFPFFENLVQELSDTGY